LGGDNRHQASGSWQLIFFFHCIGCSFFQFVLSLDVLFFSNSVEQTAQEDSS
jgi:hypothetical protein